MGTMIHGIPQVSEKISVSSVHTPQTLKSPAYNRKSASSLFKRKEPCSPCDLHPSPHLSLIIHSTLNHIIMHMLRIIALCAAGVYAFNPRSVDHSLKPTFQHCTPTEEASFTKAIDIASSCLEKVVHLREKIGSTPDPDEREMHCRYFGISSSVDEKHISGEWGQSDKILQVRRKSQG